MSTEYYYQMPSGDLSGPLPLDTIRAAISAGRLPKTTLVKETLDGPWITLESPAVIKMREMKAKDALIAKIHSDLLPCSACGKEIHRGAPTCPHCGKRRTTAGRVVLIAMLTILILLLLGGVKVVFFVR